jgi:hypothetical protein
LAGLACVGTILVIADFVNNEEQVDEVTDCAEFFITRMRIGVRNQKFVVTLDEKGPLSVGEDIVAVDPSPGLCCSFPVVRVGGSLEGLREGEEIREVKRGRC